MFGACSAASTGSQSASWSSSAMHSVWWTVSVPKSRAFWNDRARPSRARAGGLRPARSRPPSRTRPRSGTRKPETTSNSVVLPAPFGPINPRISPSCSSIVTSSSAITPANVFVVPSTASATPRVSSARHRRGDGRHHRRFRRRAFEEDRTQQVGSIEQVGGEPVEADRALLEEVGPIGGVQRGVHRLLHDDHGHAVVVQLPHHTEQLLDQQRAQTERQLVDHQDLRLDEERHRDA